MNPLTSMLRRPRQSVLPSDGPSSCPPVPVPNVSLSSASVVLVSSAADAFTKQCDELARALDAKPGTRAALKHLVFLEENLNKHGLVIIAELPDTFMTRAKSQLAILLQSEATPLLLDLATSIAEFGLAEGAEIHQELALALDTDVMRLPDVSEGTMSDFMAAVWSQNDAETAAAAQGVADECADGNPKLTFGIAS
jgi:hypothetical protein